MMVTIASLKEIRILTQVYGEVPPTRNLFLDFAIAIIIFHASFSKTKKYCKKNLHMRLLTQKFLGICFFRPFN